MTIAFSDIKHYPHGFRRSGDFSIKESERLERFGTLFHELVTGKKTAQTAEEKDFFKQLTGKSPVTSVEVLAWNKYQTKISQSRQYFPLCSTPTEAEAGVAKKSAGADDGDGAADIDVDDALEEGDDDSDDMDIEET